MVMSQSVQKLHESFHCSVRKLSLDLCCHYSEQKLKIRVQEETFILLVFIKVKDSLKLNSNIF